MTSKPLFALSPSLGMACVAGCSGGGGGNTISQIPATISSRYSELLLTINPHHADIHLCGSCARNRYV